MTLPIHPAAEAWPLLRDDEIDALADSIKTVGLLSPITTWTDPDTGTEYLLDGRNRLAACERAKIKPTFVPYQGADPVLFVLASNEQRRHVTPSQRAMAVAMTLTGRPGGDRRSDQSADLHPDSSAAAAARTQVSERLVKMCRYVHQYGGELADAVLAGTIKATAAEEETRRRVRKAQAEARKLHQLEVESEDLAEDFAWATTDDGDEDHEADLDHATKEHLQRINNAKAGVQQLNTLTAEFPNYKLRLDNLLANVDFDLAISHRTTPHALHDFERGLGEALAAVQKLITQLEGKTDDDPARQEDAGVRASA